MAFAKPANRRIARHDANICPAQRDQPGCSTHAGSRRRGLCPRVPRTNHHDIKMFHVKQPSFPDTEAGENFTQQHFDINPSDKAFQRTGRPSQMVGRHFGSPRSYLIHRQF